MRFTQLILLFNAVQITHASLPPDPVSVIEEEVKRKPATCFGKSRGKVADAVDVGDPLALVAKIGSLFNEAEAYHHGTRAIHDYLKTTITKLEVLGRWLEDQLKQNVPEKALIPNLNRFGTRILNPLELAVTVMDNVTARTDKKEERFRRLIRADDIEEATRVLIETLDDPKMCLSSWSTAQVSVHRLVSRALVNLKTLMDIRDEFV